MTTKIKNMDQEYAGIDIIKFFCSLLIVAIHVPPFISIDLKLNFYIVNYLARLAVPFFFICGSYFLFRKIPYDVFDIKMIIKYSLRMIKLYTIWFIIYHAVSWVLHGITLEQIIIYFTGYSHLWYLKSAAFAILLTGLLIWKKVSLKKIIFIALIIYIVGLFGQSYYGVLFDMNNRIPIYVTRNGLFSGFLFTSIGAFFAYEKFTINNNKALGLFIISMIFWAIESRLIYIYDLALEWTITIFLVPSVFFLFYLLINTKLHTNINTKQLRKYSMYIYFIHILIDRYFSKGIKLIQTYTKVDFKIHSLVQYNVVLFVSLVLAYIILSLSKRKQWNWLKILG